MMTGAIACSLAGLRLAESAPSKCIMRRAGCFGLPSATPVGWQGVGGGGGSLGGWRGGLPLPWQQQDGLGRFGRGLAGLRGWVREEGGEGREVWGELGRAEVGREVGEGQGRRRQVRQWQRLAPCPQSCQAGRRGAREPWQRGGSGCGRLRPGFAAPGLSSLLSSHWMCGSVAGAG